MNNLENTMRLPYTKLAPEAYEAMLAAGHALNTNTALQATLLGLVRLRASLVNQCSFCAGMHSRELLGRHEPQTRIDALSDWRSSNAFTPRERAALAWTDVLTRLQPDAITNIQDHHASDAEYEAVTEHFRDKDLVDLTLAIAQINAWNRLGIAFAAEWNPPQPKQPEAQVTSV